ncbi:MAG: hypothetical protein H6Q68_3898 [Firmicutes bacterium]|nr:hypothetical protein [Bacillota bacterium]
MRLRRHYKNYKRSETEENKDDESQVSESELGEKEQKPKKTQNEQEARDPINVKEGKSVKPFKMIKQLMSNPNFNMQIMVILLTLTSDNLQMDRRIDGMTTTIDKVRNITELVNNGMQSMKMVSEVPKSIRRILE